jgi:hypothetical protein
MRVFPSDHVIERAELYIFYKILSNILTKLRIFRPVLPLVRMTPVLDVRCAVLIRHSLRKLQPFTLFLQPSLTCLPCRKMSLLFPVNRESGKDDRM